MTRDSQQAQMRLIDRYLDGTLSEVERREFDARVAVDATLRAELAQHEAIRAGLRRSASPPRLDDILARIEAAQRAGRVAQLRRHNQLTQRVQYAVAAVLLLAIGGGTWMYWQHLNAPPRPVQIVYPPQAWRSLETVYRDTVKNGFTADWECKSEQEFAGTFRARFGQALLLAVLPPGVQSLGLAYCHNLSKDTTHLLARVDGEDVIVFVDKLERDAPQELPTGSDLHLFRREVGKLVLYELTPLDQPRVLGLFYDPDQPEGPITP